MKLVLLILFGCFLFSCGPIIPGKTQEIMISFLSPRDSLTENAYIVRGKKKNPDTLKIENRFLKLSTVIPKSHTVTFFITYQTKAKVHLYNSARTQKAIFNCRDTTWQSISFLQKGPH